MKTKGRTKGKILFRSFATIALCCSVAVGGTYALFTSESEVNIAVTSGTVKVTANIDTESLATYSMNKRVTDAEGNYVNGFENGGTASFTTVDGVQQLELTNITPGDKATFAIDVTNHSNVDVQYRFTWAIADEGLAEVLEATVDEEKLVENTTEWAVWEAEAEEQSRTFDVSVSLPVETGNDYQNKSAKISFTMEAVQANGAQYYQKTIVDSAEELHEALNDNGNIILNGNVDLSGYEWEPIAEFSGILDGNGYTISGISGTEGLCVALNGATVKNVTLDGSVVAGSNNHTGLLAGAIKKDENNKEAVTVLEDITTQGSVTGGEYYTGGLVGAISSYHSIVRGCVNNATVTSDGQQVGGIFGYAKREVLIEDCTNNGTVTGSGFVGGIIGLIAGEDDDPSLYVTVQNCTNKGTVSATGAYAEFVGGIVGVVGREGGNSPVNPIYAYILDCTVVDGKKVYGGKINVATGKDEMITVYDSRTEVALAGELTFAELNAQEGINFKYDESYTSGPVVLDGQGTATITDWVDAWYYNSLTIRGVTFASGACFTAKGIESGAIVLIEDCTFYACDQDALVAAGEGVYGRIDNSGAGMCLNIETAAGVTVIVRNCTFEGDGGADVERNGYQNWATANANNRNKARGHAICINGISGVSTDKFESVLIEDCVINNMRGNAIQLYTFNNPITIRNTTVNAWGQNKLTLSGGKSDAAIRGDLAAGASSSLLTIENVTFGLDEIADNILHVNVNSYEGNTDGTRTAGTY